MIVGPTTWANVELVAVPPAEAGPANPAVAKAATPAAIPIRRSNIVVRPTLGR
jgi:hypothetical protein